MRRPVLTAFGLMLLAAAAAAQTRVYNPRFLEFESVDHATVVHYTVQAFVEPAELGGPPVASWSVPVADVQAVPATEPPRYRIAFAGLAQQLPAGTSYRFRVLAVGAGEAVSNPSDLAPELVRWSTCVSDDGVVRPLTIAVGPLPTLRVGERAVMTLTLTAPRPVRVVTIDLLTDGQPAWYFVSTVADLRTERAYTIGPFVAPASSFLTIEATDEQGCRAQLNAGLVQVAR